MSLFHKQSLRRKLTFDKNSCSFCSNWDIFTSHQRQTSQRVLHIPSTSSFSMLTSHLEHPGFKITSTLNHTSAWLMDDSFHLHYKYTFSSLTAGSNTSCQAQQCSVSLPGYHSCITFSSSFFCLYQSNIISLTGFVGKNTGKSFLNAKYGHLKAVTLQTDHCHNLEEIKDYASRRGEYREIINNRKNYDSSRLISLTLYWDQAFTRA